MSGLERCVHELAVAFAREGMEPMVAAHLRPGGLFWYMTRIRGKLSGTAFPCSTGLGYPVYRGYDPGEHLEELLERTKPDCLLIQAPECGPLIEKTKSCGLPVFVYLHDVEIEGLYGDPAKWTWVRFIANSRFTRDFYARKCGIESAVVYPLIELSDLGEQSHGDQVLFINPVAVKGVDIAFRLASRLPQFKFFFQEGWPLAKEPLAKLQERLRKCSNVTFERLTSDRKQFFEKARILIVPSLCEEGFGRVVVEAQATGIPVIASDRGGLAEAVGEGGVIISDPENVDEWIPAIERMMTDREHYQKMSKAARRNAVRPEFSRDHIVNSLIEMLTE